MRTTITRALDAVKRGAASLTDGLASIGERMPGLASITVSAGGVTVTATPPPKPVAAAMVPDICPTCGRPR